MAYIFKHGDRPLEGYTIQHAIGRGGFGEVYYALSDGGREVALKYLRDNAEIELRGVTQCMNLKSPHLVTIFDVKKNNEGDYFIIMEHIAGPSLADLLVAESSGLGVEKAAFLVREIGKGLAYLHDMGIVHRDLKPANIFYEDGHVKIGDYGLSKFISVSRHSAQTTSVGTIHYMAPEVGSGNYHRGIDIYALGVMLYEMLLGRVPFEGSSLGEVLMKHLTEQPEVEGLPQPFAPVIRKALAKDPKDRYQTVNDMIDDLMAGGTVQESLAGFNPSTISAAARRPATERMHSPVPSPSPPLAYPIDQHPFVGPRQADLPRRVQDKWDRVSHKVARKMDKLAGRKGRLASPPAPHYQAPHVTAGNAASAAAEDAGRSPAAARFVLALMMVAATCVGMGLLIGITNDRASLGASTGMMIAAVLLGIKLSGWIVRWMRQDAEARWVRHIVTVVSCAPLMAVANAPVSADVSPKYFALMMGLLIIAVFSDWNGRVESGRRGELSFWSAAWLALMAAFACAGAGGMMDVRHPELMAASGAAVAGPVSLLIQALAWLLRPAGVAAPSSGSNAKRVRENATPRVGAAAAWAGDDVRGHRNQRRQHGYRHGNPASEGIPFGIPLQETTRARGEASVAPPPRVRSEFERSCFSVLAFLMVVGSVIATMSAALKETYSVADTNGIIVAAIGCFSLTLFSFQKLTHRKREGFWRETACPFLMAVVMTALGMCITFVAAGSFENSDEFTISVIGIVISSITLLTLLWSRFRRPRRQWARGERAVHLHDFVSPAAGGGAGERSESNEPTADHADKAMGVESGGLGV